MPITPEQIQSVLGNAQIREIAHELGLPEDAASSPLSQTLPTVVDKLPGKDKLRAAIRWRRR